MIEQVRHFYNSLADVYELIFDDWDRSRARQGQSIVGLLDRKVGSGRLQCRFFHRNDKFNGKITPENGFVRIGSSWIIMNAVVPPINGELTLSLQTASRPSSCNGGDRLGGDRHRTHDQDEHRTRGTR